ncbi:hypothetical protein TNCV_3659581 [Trichonephila clavipes]|nr:hypothetical protein TNCV_3659581 [Trichonephila clavipes]
MDRRSNISHGRFCHNDEREAFHPIRQPSKSGVSRLLQDMDNFCFKVLQSTHCQWRTRGGRGGSTGPDSPP